MHLTICWCVVWDWHEKIHNLAIQQTCREFYQSDREVWQEVGRWSTWVIQQLHDCLSDREARGHSQTTLYITQLILAFSLLECAVKIIEHEQKQTNKQNKKRTKGTETCLTSNSYWEEYGLGVRGDSKRSASVLRYLCSRSSFPYGKHSDVSASPKQV